jgi:ATP-binding cassette subfamily F protein uup
MIEWLEAILQKKTVVYGDARPFFLERVCNEIIELDNGKLYQYKLLLLFRKKEERIASENSSVDKAQNLL